MWYEFRTVITTANNETSVEYDQRNIDDNSKVWTYVKYLHKKYQSNGKNKTAITFKVNKSVE